MTRKVIDYKVVGVRGWGGKDYSAFFRLDELLNLINEGYELFGHPVALEGAIYQAVVKYEG